MITKITIKKYITCMTILLIVCTACMYWIYNSRQAEINHLQAERNILENYRLSQPSLKAQINNLENANIKLTKQLENVTISYNADKLYIDYVNYQYLKAISWINIAELIFDNNDITFPLYLGDRELRIEEAK